jgi:hypothetical protein
MRWCGHDYGLPSDGGHWRLLKSKASGLGTLCEFRQRLIAGNAELLLFETMLTLFRQQGLIKAKGRMRTDSTQVLVGVLFLRGHQRVPGPLKLPIFV